MDLMDPRTLGFAAPGDTDLDFDVDNLRITSVFVLDSEVTFELHGGIGHWSGEGESPLRDVPAADDLVDKVHVSAVVELSTDSVARAYATWYKAQLRRWEQEETPLRMLCAPGRPSVLMQDETAWIVVPRSTQ